MVKSETQNKIGIMGGTFDPIHYGHLVMAEEVRMRFGLEEVIFVPCGIPPHPKHYNVTDSEHRYLMAVLATAANPHFSASRIEIDRPGPSFAIDTLREFKRLYGDASRLYFITGADAILEILLWRNHEQLLKLARFVAATRPGYNLDELRSRLTSEQLDDIDFVQVPGIEISSTEIRQRVRSGQPIRYLTPSATEAYIQKNALYLNSQSGMK